MSVPTPGGEEGRQGRGLSPRQRSLLPAPGAAGPAVPGLVNRRRPGVTARNYEVAGGAGSPAAASIFPPLGLRPAPPASVTFSCRCFLTLIPPPPSAPPPQNSDRHNVSYRKPLVLGCTPAPETGIKTRSSPSSRQSLHRRRRKAAKTAQAASGGGAGSRREPPETPPHALRSGHRCPRGGGRDPRHQGGPGRKI